MIFLHNLPCQSLLVRTIGLPWCHVHAGLKARPDGMEGYEAARRDFESLFQESSPRSSHSTPLNKPLTANSMRIKDVELKLLRQLADSDDVVDPLVDLWVGERADASQMLRNMEEVGNCSPGLQQEEGQLRAMIERYGIEWVEPMSRLAVLLFTKGRNTEAIDLAWKVLEAKPWHFEAGQLLVVMLLREGRYPEALKVARSYSLPPLNENTNHRRRKAWVEEKLWQANEFLTQARMVTVSAIKEDSSVEELCSLEEDFCWQ